MNKVTITSFALALMTSSSALAQTAKYDENIARAAASKAAEKVGKMRGSISFEKNPKMVTKADLVKKKINTSFLPQKQAPKENSLPPMTSNNHSVDLTVTGSIQTQKPAGQKILYWEKFDRYGNPIK